MDIDDKTKEEIENRVYDFLNKFNVSVFLSPAGFVRELTKDDKEAKFFIWLNVLLEMVRDQKIGVNDKYWIIRKEDKIK